MSLSPRSSSRPPSGPRNRPTSATNRAAGGGAKSLTPLNSSAPAAGSRAPIGMRNTGAAIISDRALLSGLSETAQKAFVEKQQRRQLHQLVGMSLSYVSSVNSPAAIAARPNTSAGVLGGASTDGKGFGRIGGGGLSSTIGGNSTRAPYGLAPAASSYLPLHQYGDGIDVFADDGLNYTTANRKAPTGHQGRGVWDPRNPNGDGSNVIDDSVKAGDEEEAARLYTREGINHSKGILLQQQMEEERAKYMDQRKERLKQLLREQGATEDDVEATMDSIARNEDTSPAGDDTTPSEAVTSAILRSAAASRSRPPSASMIPLYPNGANSPSRANSAARHRLAAAGGGSYGVMASSPSYQSPPNGGSPNGGGGGGGVNISTSFYPNQHQYTGSIMMRGAGGARRPMSSSMMRRGGSSSRPVSAATSRISNNRSKQLISALAIAPYPSRSGRPMNCDFLIRALEKDPNNAVAWDCIGALMAEGRLRTHLIDEWVAIADRRREEKRAQEAALAAEMEAFNRRLQNGGEEDKDAPSAADAIILADVSKISAGDAAANNTTSPPKVRAWRTSQRQQLVHERAVDEEAVLREERHQLVLLTPAQQAVHHTQPRPRFILGREITSGAVLNSSNTMRIPVGEGGEGLIDGSTGNASLYKKVNAANDKALGDPLCDCCEDGLHGAGAGERLGEPAMFCYVNGERYTPTACFAKAIEHDPHLGSAWGHLAMWLIKKQREPTLLLMMMGMLSGGGGMGAGKGKGFADPNAMLNDTAASYSYPFGLRAQQMLSDDNAVEDRYYSVAGEGGDVLYPSADGVGYVDCKGVPVPHHTNYTFVHIEGKPYTMRDCLVKALEGYDDTKTNAAAWNYLGVNLGNNFQANRDNKVGDDGDESDMYDDEDEDEEDTIDGDGFGKGWPTDPSSALGLDMSGGGNNKATYNYLKGGSSVADGNSSSAGSPQQGGANSNTSPALSASGAHPANKKRKAAYLKQPAIVQVGGRDYNAKKCFQRALECDLTFPEAWVNMAMTLNPDGNNPRDSVVIKGKIYTQRQCMMKVLSMHPHYSHAWNTLGFMLEPLVEVVAIVPDEAGSLRLMQAANGTVDYSNIVLSTDGIMGSADQPYGFDDSKNGTSTFNVNGRGEEASSRNPINYPRQPLLASVYDPRRHGRYVPQVLAGKERARVRAAGDGGGVSAGNAFASAARIADGPQASSE